jgi:urease accessory protein
MDYATPATMLEGLLSGLGHPIIGIDHLIFILGAGVLAASVPRGFLLPLAFVIASGLAVCVRFAGSDIALSELWVAGSLLVVAAILLLSAVPGRGVIAGLCMLAGAIHGYALAEGIVGAEKTPLVGYLLGLTAIQYALGLASWAFAAWLYKNRPQVPLRRVMGVVAGLAGLAFVGLAATS